LVSEGLLSCKQLFQYLDCTADAQQSLFQARTPLVQVCQHFLPRLTFGSELLETLFELPSHRAAPCLYAVRQVVQAEHMRHAPVEGPPGAEYMPSGGSDPGSRLSVAVTTDEHPAAATRRASNG